MTNFETTVFHLLAHFLLWILMFMIFCGALFLLVLVIVAAWNLIENGYKDFKKWREMNKMIKRYIKTTPVEAIQVTKGNREEVREFALFQRIVFGYGLIKHSIETLEGKMSFSDGDYLIKNQTGECYVCRKDIFEKTYKEVSE